MLGPYEIALEGHRYFGNVSLRECHTFTHEGDAFLMDVQGMAFHSIPLPLAGLIDRLRLDPGALVPEPAMEQLRGLGLVADEEETTAGTGASDATPSEAEFPVDSISLFVTQQCNMRCVYCYGDAGEYGGAGMMDESTAFRAVDWLVENSGSVKRVHIGFFGGEPLLNFPLIRRIVPYARRQAAKAGKDATFGMTTNGSLLTDEIIAFLRDENIHPLISFDGPPEVQDRQRPFKDGAGSHARVADNIRKLLEVLPRVRGRATVWGDADPLLIRQGLRDVGFATCLLAPVSPVLPDGSGPAAPANGAGERRLERMLTLHRLETAELLDDILERRFVTHGPLSNELAAMEGLLTGRKRHHGCGIGKGMVGITTNGDIYPCHRFAGQPGMRQGNIREYKAGAITAYHRAIVDDLPRCRTCWARYLCGGGCFYHNKDVTGDMRRPDPLGCRERTGLYEGLIRVCCRLDEADREYVTTAIKNRASEDAP